MDFKKSFMGGYRKKDVDLALWELENKTEKLQEDVNALTERNETLEEENKTLGETIEAQSERCENLLRELAESSKREEEALKAREQSNQKNEGVVGRAYISAVKAGESITEGAADDVEALLMNIESIASQSLKSYTASSEDFYNNAAETRRLIEEIENRAGHLKELLTDMSDAADSLSPAYDNLQQIRREQSEKARDILEQYRNETPEEMPEEKSADEPAGIPAGDVLPEEGKKRLRVTVKRT